MNNFPECEHLTGRKRAICRNEAAGVSLCGKNSVNAYRVHWGLDALPGDCPASKAAKPKQTNKTSKANQPVGDVLAALIAEYGLKPIKSCGCASKAAQMNQWGIDGCRAHRDDIIKHLKTAYHSSTWSETFKAGGNAVFQSLPLTLGGMVDEAIRRTEAALSFRPVETDRPTDGKRLVITIATGDTFSELLSITSPLMKSYATRCGADFVALTNATQSWWGLEKFRVKKYAEKYDQTLFLDVDVILRGTPALFDIVPRGSVGLHNDYPHLTQDQWLRSEWTSVMASQGVSRQFPEGSCLNTGVVVCDRSTASIWEAPPRPLPGEHCDEQIWIESTIHERGFPVIELPTSLNCQWWFPDFATREPVSTIIHLANCPKHERANKARQYTAS